jgi:hypothetical protein
LYRSGVGRRGRGKTPECVVRLDLHFSACVEMKADVVEPFRDEVFVAGIEDIRIVEQQDRGPVHEVALGDEAEAPAFERIGDVFTGDDNAGLGDGKAVMSRAALGQPSVGLFLRLEVDVEDPLKGAAHLIYSDLKQSEATHHIELLIGQGRK